MFETTAATLTSGEGNELSHAPGYSASLAVDYVFPIMANWNLTLHADHAWVDGHFADAGNTPELEVPKWTKANASATARSDDGKWRIALFGSNLANDEIIRDLPQAGTFFWHMPRQNRAGSRLQDELTLRTGVRRQRLEPAAEVPPSRVFLWTVGSRRSGTVLPCSKTRQRPTREAGPIRSDRSKERRHRGAMGEMTPELIAIIGVRHRAIHRGNTRRKAPP